MKVLHSYISMYKSILIILVLFGSIAFGKSNSFPASISIVSVSNDLLYIGTKDSSIVVFEIRDSLGIALSSGILVKISMKIDSVYSEQMSSFYDTTNAQGRVIVSIHAFNYPSLVSLYASIDSGRIRTSPIRIENRKEILQTEAREYFIPNEFNLYQNYPNPFNPSTVISYYVPSKTDISLEILNPLGERIVLLDKGIKEVGRQTVRWNARVASGMYYCRLITSNGCIVRKMLLLK